MTLVTPGRPRRGELWWADLDPGVGRELGRKVRPVVIASVEEINTSALEKIVVVPSTTKSLDVRTRVPWRIPLSGGALTTYFCCEDVRAISVERLRGRVGTLVAPRHVMEQIERTLRYLLGL